MYHNVPGFGERIFDPSSSLLTPICRPCESAKNVCPAKIPFVTNSIVVDAHVAVLAGFARLWWFVVQGKASRNETNA